MPETASIPIIVVSFLDQKRTGFALGAADYLIKPVDKAVLLQSIRKHIQPKKNADSILIVDDDRKTVELVEEMLRASGYKTLSAPNGREALTLLASTPVSALLLDLLMPEMNGFEVIEHMQQDEHLSEVPIFVLTGKELSQKEIDLLSRQTEALFQKTGSWRQQLVAEVSKVIHQRKLARAAGQT